MSWAGLHFSDLRCCQTEFDFLFATSLRGKSVCVGGVLCKGARAIALEISGDRKSVV